MPGASEAADAQNLATRCPILLKLDQQGDLGEQSSKTMPKAPQGAWK